MAAHHRRPADLETSSPVAETSGEATDTKDVSQSPFRRGCCVMRNLFSATQLPSSHAVSVACRLTWVRRSERGSAQSHTLRDNITIVIVFTDVLRVTINQHGACTRRRRCPTSWRFR